MCFSLAWVEQLLIYVIVFAVVVGILRLLLPYILGALGAGGSVIAGAINLVLWGAIAIFVVVFCFDLISCLGGLHFARMSG
jgi:hypothetical protein